MKTRVPHSTTWPTPEIATEIQEGKVELDGLIEEVARAGENELGQIRARRDHLWQFIRASAFEQDSIRPRGSREVD